MRAAGRSVAVVGAGIAGLACADALKRAGMAVTVFEKARGPGGRISTRRAEAGSFDHGAQYFTARDPEFAKAVRAWVEAGVAAPWRGRIVTWSQGRTAGRAGDAERFVAVPTMSALAKHLARVLDVRCNVRVEALERAADDWTLRDESAHVRGPFDAAVVATPAPQAAALLPQGTELRARVAEAKLAPCLAAMVGFDAPVEVEFDGVLVSGGPLAWAARDSAKPGRSPGERWVLHAAPEWSEAHLEEAPDAFARELLAAFAEVSGRPLPDASHLVGHRWRFARATRPLPQSHLFDAALRLGVCGDWCGGDKVEAAWRSGVALAARLLAEAT